MSVEEPGGLLDQITGWQFKRWQEFFELRPFGSAQEDLRAGVLSMLLHNAWFKGSKEPADFFPSLAVPWWAEDPEAEVREVRAWVRATGGTVVEPGKEPAIAPEPGLGDNGTA